MNTILKLKVNSKQKNIFVFSLVFIIFAASLTACSMQELIFDTKLSGNYELFNLNNAASTIIINTNGQFNEDGKTGYIEAADENSLVFNYDDGTKYNADYILDELFLVIKKVCRYQIYQYR